MKIFFILFLWKFLFNSVSRYIEICSNKNFSEIGVDEIKNTSYQNILKIITTKTIHKISQIKLDFFNIILCYMCSNMYLCEIESDEECLFNTLNLCFRKRYAS